MAGAIPCIICGMRIFQLLVLLTLSSPVLAWGAKGHRVIGALAEERLTPAASAAVTAILQGEDLATVSTWADEMRGSGDHAAFWLGYAAQWHYVNIPQGGTYTNAPVAPRGDAYLALHTLTAILNNEPVPVGPVRDGLLAFFGTLDTDNPELKRFALKFLIHIIGDLQQPFHSGYAEDRGGNDLDVYWFGEKTNLHVVWDSKLVELRDQSDTELAQRLSNRISRTPASDIRYFEAAAPELWIEESGETLKRINARFAKSQQLDKNYAAEFVPTVETQLVKGGLRTAYILNSIFGD